MLSAFFENKILKKLEIEPTKEQRELIFRLSNFIENPTDEIFILNGYAGTGKTTIIGALVKALISEKRHPILMAPTGRAAKILSHFSALPAYTIHRLIYKPKNPSNPFSKFVVSKNSGKNIIYIVDEASMISGRNDSNSMFGSGNLLNDLIAYVFQGTGNKIIFVGDTAQLPPVGDNRSVVFDVDFMHGYGKNIQYFELLEVVRQSQQSGILHNSTLIRQKINKGTTNEYPKFETEDFADIELITGEDLIEKLSDSYSQVGIDQTIVITRSNKRANRYNEGIRRTVLFRESYFENGDLVMIVKNNYLWKPKEGYLSFIANGDIAEVGHISKYENLYDMKYADAELYLLDYDTVIDAKLFIDTLSMDTPSLPQERQKNLFEQVKLTYEDIKDHRKRYEKIKKDPYLNAIQIKFAYAITCHKSQGGQWKHVFLDWSFFGEQATGTEFYRWLYTALTRATEKLYIVNYRENN